MALKTDRLKDKARKLELKDQPAKAIDVYLRIIELLEGTPEIDHELALYNKVGDLYLKTSEVHSAVEMYERAAHRYVESGLPNNAIALCNKILRNSPGRTPTYLMLGELMLRRGFAAEAKQHFIEYAQRMSKAGKIVDAFKALKKFVDASSDNEEVRAMLTEQLKAAIEENPDNAELTTLHEQITGGGRGSQVSATVDSGDDGSEGGAADLIFIDLDDDRTSDEVPTAVETAPKEIESHSLDSGAEGEGTPADVDLGLETATVESESSVDDTVFPPLEGMEGLDSLVDDSAQPPAPALAEESTIDLPELDVPDIDLDGFDDASPEPELLITDESKPETSEIEEKIEELRDSEFLLDDLAPAELSGTIDVAPEPEKTVESLEAIVAANPDDPVVRQDLAELLLEQGDRDRGLDELDTALVSYEKVENWERARAVAEEILRLEPNSLGHLQKRVEYAYRLGNQAHLVPAYLDLANALFRSGGMDQSRSVFERVLELDPENQAAQEGIATVAAPELEPTEAAPSEAGVIEFDVMESEAPAPPAPEPATPAPRSSFVDLGEFILGDEVPGKDSRMIGVDEQSGDEQRDFDDMLSQFKKGIEANIDEADAPAHYDLGVAFKEMGLLDEAIGEFQKSLRSLETRLRSAEALGQCFFEKGQFQVAATVMRRAVDADAAGEQEKIGLLYWLGRCEEEQSKAAEALGYYQRVFAVDINFQDVGDRVSTLAKAGR